MKGKFKNAIVRLMSLLMIFILMSLVACSNVIKVGNNIDAERQAILEKAKEEGKATIAALDGISDCDVYLNGNNELVYEYQYEENVELSDEQKASMTKNFDRLIVSIFPSIKKELKIDDLNVTYKFLNKDKTVAFQSTYNDSIVSNLKADAENLKVNIVPKSKEETEKILKDTKASMYNNVMNEGIYSSFDLYLNDKKEVVFEYTFKDGLHIDKDKFAELKKIIDNMIFASFVSMQEELGIEDLTVVYRYLNSDGTVANKIIYDKDVVDSLFG